MQKNYISTIICIILLSMVSSTPDTFLEDKLGTKIINYH